MKFEDHITAYWAKPLGQRGFDQAAAQARIEHLCTLMVALLPFPVKMLMVARQIRKEVRRTVIGMEQVYRHRLKLHMLRVPEWRYRVIKELGGIDKLLRLWKRLAGPKVTFKRQKTVLTWQEQHRRDHIQRCAKACANPYIYRDPFKVDRAGQFRLPPMPRQPSRKKSNRVYEYTYDARPVTDFKGINQPIMVWPEEFMVFMRYELPKPENKEEQETREHTSRRYRFTDKWLAAILAETAEVMPPRPLIKTETARAPPRHCAPASFAPPVTPGRWVGVLGKGCCGYWGFTLLTFDPRKSISHSIK